MMPYNEGRSYVYECLQPMCGSPNFLFRHSQIARRSYLRIPLSNIILASAIAYQIYVYIFYRYIALWRYKGVQEVSLWLFLLGEDSEAFSRLQSFLLEVVLTASWRCAFSPNLRHQRSSPWVLSVLRILHTSYSDLRNTTNLQRYVLLVRLWLTFI